MSGVLVAVFAGVLEIASVTPSVLSTAGEPINQTAVLLPGGQALTDGTTLVELERVHDVARCAVTAVVQDRWDVSVNSRARHLRSARISGLGLAGSASAHGRGTRAAGRRSCRRRPAPRRARPRTRCPRAGRGAAGWKLTGAWTRLGPTWRPHTFGSTA